MWPLLLASLPFKRAATRTVVISLISHWKGKALSYYPFMSESNQPPSSERTVLAETVLGYCLGEHHLKSKEKKKNNTLS